MSNQPREELRIGPIKVSIFANVADDDRVFFTASPSKAYQDEATKEWRYSTSFTLRDLTTLVFLMQKAEERMFELEMIESDRQRFQR